MSANQRIYPNIPQRGTLDGTYPVDPQTDDPTGGWLGKICATLSIGFTGMKSEMRAMRRDLAKATEAPVFNKVTDSVVIAANGFGVVRLTGPDQGHFWYIRKIMVSGLTPQTVVAGRADVYVSATDLRNLAASGLGVADWRDQATSLPLVAPYGNGELPLRMNEELYLVFSNATVGQTYVASASYIDFQEGAAAQDWNI